MPPRYGTIGLFNRRHERHRKRKTDLDCLNTVFPSLLCLLSQNNERPPILDPHRQQHVHYCIHYAYLVSRVRCLVRLGHDGWIFGTFGGRENTSGHVWRSWESILNYFSSCTTGIDNAIEWLGLPGCTNATESNGHESLQNPKPSLPRTPFHPSRVPDWNKRPSPPLDNLHAHL